MTAPVDSTGLVAAWRRNNAILLRLLSAVPDEAWTARPAGSRGRDVARMFAHLDRVRRGWVHYHRTGKRPTLERVTGDRPPSRTAVTRALTASGSDVASHLAAALAGRERIRMFGRDPVRWFTYLVAHEAHHRGQILLALKQSGFRMSEKVALQDLWGRWISGA